MLCISLSLSLALNLFLPLSQWVLITQKKKKKIRLLWNLFHIQRMFVYKAELVVKDHETMHKCLWGVEPGGSVV